MTISSIKPAVQAPPATKTERPDSSPLGGLFQQLLKTPARVTEQISKILPIGSPHHAAGARNEALSKSLEQQLGRFQKKLESALREAGIDSEDDLRLKWGSHGEVRAGGHAESARIEQILARDPELQSLFHFVTTTANYLHRGEATTRDFELTLDNGKTGYRFS